MLDVLTIDEEFKTLIPPLTTDERHGLEQDIVERGCLDPIKIWQPTKDVECIECYHQFPIHSAERYYEGESCCELYLCPLCQGFARNPFPVIVDGHNRYEICTEHDIDFETVELEFADWHEAYNWIISNQLSRRNVTPEQASYLRGKRYLAEKKDVGEHKGNQHTQMEMGQNVPIPTSTAAKLADEFKVSEKTVKRDAKFAESVDTIAKTLGQGIQQEVLSRDLQMTKQDIVEIAKVAQSNPEHAKTILQRVKSSPPQTKAKTVIKEVKQEVRHAEQQAVVEFVDAATPSEPSTRRQIAPGEWWRLGKHLLFCGDTASSDFQSRLPEAIALSFADPPYNAEAAEWDHDFLWEHDYLAEKSKVVAVTPGICSIFDFAKVTKMPYRWSLACWIANGMTRGDMGFGNWIYVAMFAESSLHRGIQDFLKVTIKTGETSETSHKGRKPTELLEYLFRHYTHEDDYVLDPFLGSGTTLFVAEAMQRKCVGGEIDPVFCHEIVTRWEALTQQQAEVW